MLQYTLKADLTDVKEIAKKYPFVFERVADEKLTDALLFLKARAMVSSPRNKGKRSKASARYGPLHSSYVVRKYKLKNSIFGLLGSDAFYGGFINTGTKYISATHFFDKSIKRGVKKAQRILKEIPGEIIKRVS